MRTKIWHYFTLIRKKNNPPIKKEIDSHTDILLSEYLSAKINQYLVHAFSSLLLSCYLVSSHNTVSTPLKSKHIASKILFHGKVLTNDKLQSPFFEQREKNHISERVPYLVVA